MMTLIGVALGALLALIKFAMGAFSDKSRLRRLELWVERTRAHGESEQERQQADYERIDAAPDKTGQDLVDDLNKKFE